MAWLSQELWKTVQDSVPIACVDILPVRRAASGGITQVGAILRDTPHQGRRWCLVGGRMLRDESFAQAVARQLRTTLGDRIGFTLAEDLEPLYVSQYFTRSRPIGNLDPRQHSVAMNFAVAITGEPVATGEAHEFGWFDPLSLPPAEQWGFEQDRVAKIILKRLEQAC